MWGGQGGEEESGFERYFTCGTNIINQTSGCGSVEVGGVEEDSGFTWVTGRVGMPIIKTEDTKAVAGLEQWQGHDFHF